jgi:hypothetical protein
MPISRRWLGLRSRLQRWHVVARDQHPQPPRAIGLAARDDQRLSAGQRARASARRRRGERAQLSVNASACGIIRRADVGADLACAPRCRGPQRAAIAPSSRAL